MRRTTLQLTGSNISRSRRRHLSEGWRRDEEGLGAKQTLADPFHILAQNKTLDWPIYLRSEGKHPKASLFDALSPVREIAYVLRKILTNLYDRKCAEEEEGSKEGGGGKGGKVEGQRRLKETHKSTRKNTS